MGHNQNAQVKSMTVCRRGLCDICKGSLVLRMQLPWKKSTHQGSMKKIDIQTGKKYSNTNLTRMVSIFYTKELITKIKKKTIIRNREKIQQTHHKIYIFMK